MITSPPSSISPVELVEPVSSLLTGYTLPNLWDLYWHKDSGFNTNRCPLLFLKIAMFKTPDQRVTAQCTPCLPRDEEETDDKEKKEGLNREVKLNIG